MNNKGCGYALVEGQWWKFCGETDMGQTAPALCTQCGGSFKRAEPQHVYETELARKLAEQKQQ